MNFDEAKKTIYKHGPKIMIFGSIALFSGAVVSGIFAGRKIERIVRKGTKEKKSSTEIRKECAKQLVIPVALAAGATALGVIGEHKTEVRIANLATGYLTIKKELETHKAVMEKILPEEQVDSIRKEVLSQKTTHTGLYSEGKATPTYYVYNTGTGDQVWYDEKHDRWFRASIEAVNEAVKAVNAELKNRDWCSVAVFYTRLGLKAPDGDEHDGFVFKKGTNSYYEYEHGVSLLDEYTEKPDTRELARVISWDHPFTNEYEYNVFG